MTSHDHQQGAGARGKTRDLARLQALRETLHRLYTLTDGQDYKVSQAASFSAGYLPRGFVRADARQGPVRAQREMAGARMMLAVELGSQWEHAVIEAEALADDLGIPLALPRTTPPRIRQGARPPPGTILEDRRSLIQIGGDLAKAIQMSLGRLDACLERCNELAAAIESGDAPDLVAPEDPVTAFTPDLEARFARLETAGRALMDAAASNARTTVLLTLAIRWQEEATDLRNHADRWGIDFHPPLNDSGDLRAFARTLGPVLEELQGRLEALRSRSPEG